MDPLLIGYEMSLISARWLEIQIVSIAICLEIFGVHVDILFIIKVKNVRLIEWSYKFP